MCRKKARAFAIAGGGGGRAKSQCIWERAGKSCRFKMVLEKAGSGNPKTG